MNNSDVIHRYDKLVWSFVHGFRNRYKRPGGFDCDDLYQEGIVALLNAYRSYMPGRGVKFITFATRCIGNHFASLLQRESRHGNERNETWWETSKSPLRNATIGTCVDTDTNLLSLLKHVRISREAFRVAREIVDPSDGFIHWLNERGHTWHPDCGARWTCPKVRKFLRITPTRWREILHELKNAIVELQST